jgi:hypothetical protein
VLHSLEQLSGPELKAVVLFAPRVRGTARPDSDLGLFMLTEGFSREPLPRKHILPMALLPVLEDLPGRITYVVHTPETVAVNFTPLLLDVCVDGICLRGEAYFGIYREEWLEITIILVGGAPHKSGATISNPEFHAVYP